jgi:gluconolactonase
MQVTFEVFDPRLSPLIPNGTEVEVIFDRGAFTEGPVWFADLQCLIWSDIPNSRLHRWTPDGHVSVFRATTNNTNGNTRDRQGRLLSCEHSGRRVTRTELDGTLTVIAERFEGGRFNSPNDVVVTSDNAIWFTDPDYGRPRDQPKEQAHESVYRIDPASGAITAVVTDFQKPNGLAFSPDEHVLYIADSAVSNDPNGNSHLRRFDVHPDGTISGGEVFATTEGIPDGLRVDTAGNVSTSAGNGVNVYAPDATWLGRVGGLPAAATNVAFGGPENNRLFITAGPAVYALTVNARGVQWP